MSIITPISGPHTRAQRSVSSVMHHVILALLPATAFGVYLFGWPALFTLLLCIVSAWGFELLSLWMAGKPVRPYATDGSAMLTGLLLALTLPPWAPWWLCVLGSFIAIVIGKHIFGGLGQNVFNPAMLARVALLVSFPLEMTTWANPAPFGSELSPSFMAALAITFGGAAIDGVTSASVLGHVKTEATLGNTIAQALPDGFATSDYLLGFSNGSLGETSALLILIGGIYLIAMRIITWHIPVAMIGSMVIISLLFHAIDPNHYPGAIYHLLSGGLLLGAFFIATDLVTSPSSVLGKLIFGAGCGLLTYIIRTWGGFPEGVAFAVILMNSMTPLIDHYCRPRIYGRDRKGEPLAIEAAKNREGEP